MPSLCHKCDLLSIIYVTCNGVRGERRGGGLHSCGGHGKHVRCLVYIMLTRHKEKTISNARTIIHKLGVLSLIHATRHTCTSACTHTRTSSKLYLREDSHTHNAFSRSLPQLEPSQNNNIIITLSSANTLTAIRGQKIMIRANML